MKEIHSICKKLEKLHRKYVDGFVTIEYTLLMPALMILYTFLICIGLYLYNSCILTTNVYILGTEGARLTESSANGKLEKLQQKEAQLYHDKYLLVSDMQTTYSIRGDQINISGEGKMGNPLGLFGIGEAIWPLQAETESRIISPMETLRLCKAIYSVAQEMITEEEQEDDS